MALACRLLPMATVALGAMLGEPEGLNAGAGESEAIACNSGKY